MTHDSMLDPKRPTRKTLTLTPTLNDPRRHAYRTVAFNTVIEFGTAVYRNANIFKYRPMLPYTMSTLNQHLVPRDSGAPASPKCRNLRGTAKNFSASSPIPYPSNSGRSLHHWSYCYSSDYITQCSISQGCHSPTPRPAQRIAAIRTATLAGSGSR